MNFVEKWMLLSAVDVVVRAHFYKYFHPKEALVSNGVLNRYSHQHVVMWLLNDYGTHL